MLRQQMTYGLKLNDNAILNNKVCVDEVSMHSIHVRTHTDFDNHDPKMRQLEMIVHGLLRIQDTL